MSTYLILLIDDDPVSNKFNSMIIQRNHPNIEIIALTGAMEAIQYLKDLTRKPDLIFLDLNMPVMNGWDFMEEYHKLNLNIEIMIITSSEDPKDMDKAENYNEIKGYVVKPISKVALSTIFDRFSG